MTILEKDESVIKEHNYLRSWAEMDERVVSTVKKTLKGSMLGEVHLAKSFDRALGAKGEKQLVQETIRQAVSIWGMSDHPYV